MDVIHHRKSVRKYLDKPVEREKLENCVEAARLAPSADNIQPWRFIVLDEPEFKADFCRNVIGGFFKRSKFIEKAPVIIVVVAKLNIIVHKIAKAAIKTNVHLIDIGIAGEHLVLRAEEQGLGTCWINWFNPKKAQKYLNIPKKYRVISLIAVGYPAQGATRDRPDLPIEEILLYNKDYSKKL